MKRVTLGDIADIVSGGTPARNQPKYWGGRIPWVKTGEVDFCTITATEEHITEEGLENSSARIVPKGTILMAMYGQGKTRGQVAILGIDAAVNQACAAILLNEEADRDFVYQQLAFHYLDIRKLSNSGQQNNLNADLIRGVAFPLPPKPEQRRIAAILRAWDAAAQRLTALLNSKNQRLNSLRQQLITGAKRFPSFKKQAWLSRKIGELLNSVNRYEDWDDNRIFKLAGVRRNSGGVFFRDELPGQKIKVKVCKKIHANDFLISRRQITWGGMSIVPPEFHGYDVNDEYEVLQVRDPATFDMRFFHYLSQTATLKNLAYLASNGVFAERLRLNFDLKAFLNQPMRVPPTKAEQLEIVTLLDACVREIRLLEAELEALKQQKRGLMQKLLTGEIRVKT